MARLRQLEDRDIGACAHIGFLNWGPEVAHRIRNELEISGPRGYVVAGDWDTPLAFATLERCHVMADTWALTWCNVHPEFQNRGLGSALTRERIDYIRGQAGTLIFAMTREWKFYYRFGFLICRAFDDWNFMALKLGSVGL